MIGEVCNGGQSADLTSLEPGETSDSENCSRGKWLSSILYLFSQQGGWVGEVVTLSRGRSHDSEWVTSVTLEFQELTLTVTCPVMYKLRRVRKIHPTMSGLKSSPDNARVKRNSQYIYRRGPSRTLRHEVSSCCRTTSCSASPWWSVIQGGTF